MKTMMYRDAVREALDEEMARDENVFMMGEDIGVDGGNFKCTVGLRDKYGDLRVKDTPISEQGFIGMGVGAALRGSTTEWWYVWIRSATRWLRSPTCPADSAMCRWLSVCRLAAAVPLQHSTPSPSTHGLLTARV